MKRLLLVPVALSIALAGCGRSDDAGSSVTINADGGGAAMNGSSGEVSIDTPIFKGSLKLPKFDLTADNFDINGVHLYPGSKIGNVNVNAQGNDDGIVSMTFDSPASVDTVRDWLAAEFAKKGTKVSVDGNRLKGETEDKAFSIDLTPAGDRATGKVTIG